MFDYFTALIIMLGLTIVSVALHNRGLTYVLLVLAFIPIINMVVVFSIFVIGVMTFTNKNKIEKGEN